MLRRRSFLRLGRNRGHSHARPLHGKVGSDDLRQHLDDRRGPAQRPAIVITSGSVQAPETLYWGLAATLASHGYVVMTYDTQGQSRSDTFGEGADTQEERARPAADELRRRHRGGARLHALDRSRPIRSARELRTRRVRHSHAPKQDRRVADGLNAAFNPAWQLVDDDRVGIAGQSLGAAAVSFVGQKDPRVDAIVAWDNLRGADKASDCASAPASREDATPSPSPRSAFRTTTGSARRPSRRIPTPRPERPPSRNTRQPASTRCR